MLIKSNTTIFITGSSGFVGKNVVDYFEKTCTFSKYIKGTYIDITQEAVIHLAGKAHDLKNIIDPNEYYQTNTKLTKELFDNFLESNAKVFITISSVKAAADVLDNALTEEHIPKPITHYGKSKLLAEEYILSKKIPTGKRVYILRPCMIHGPGNKGNLNLLYKIVKKGIPWPLGSFDNKRSFCSIDNLCFIINELIINDQIASGVYNIADDETLSTNELIKLIAQSLAKRPFILNIPKYLINGTSKLGDIFKLPLNSERLSKLTENYVVSNQKIKNAINKSLPVSAKVGLLKTFNSFLNAK
jgi:nucleoside-diphosphate-sugar epimerase